MREGREYFYFNSAETDSVYAVEQLRRQKEKEGLSEWETRRLAFMERRLEEGKIYLTPAVIYAAANQRSCEGWMKRADEKRQERWYADGVAWMRRCPAFLERFGWKERRTAVMAAGILARAEEEAAGEAMDALGGLLRSGWKFLWDRIRHGGCLDAESWAEMLKPWKESEGMSCGMAGVLLVMAALLDKPVYDRDQLWRDLQRLRSFSQGCMERPETGSTCLTAFPFQDDKKMEWLMKHFKNPQKLCSVQEKGRIDSEWREQLFRVMRMAGLPASTCETITLSCREVQMLLGELEGRPSPQKYMTFLALYTVAKELAAAGRAAAALETAVR